MFMILNGEGTVELTGDDIKIFPPKDSILDDPGPSSDVYRQEITDCALVPFTGA